jgi:uncharacterized membrane protein
MLFHLVLALHIAAGGTALLAGPIPMLARKGGRLHRRAGDAYAIAMTATAVSALILAVIISSILFLGLAVFTFFLVFCGARAIGVLRGAAPSQLDRAVCALTAAFSLWLLWHGIATGNLTSLFFGAFGVILPWRQWRRLRDPAGTDWLVVHLTSMGGAYIATTTAFLAVNLTFLPQALVFIAPTLIGAPLIARATARYRRAPAASPA